ncbi:MAG: SAM-dependent methyltransferase [Thaumarchaeota archaeon]|jgi:2-polyprenyl-3-methyl-5-hydroxy-6-metoxy-1,4-benzoquinol methylase|nr:MAG: SAM-dependent methyltransferase [Nitrososphaerota archaeon]
MNNKKNYCRFCKSELKNIFLDLGEIPSANSFLNEEEIEQERKYPLCVYICKKCLLVQIPEIRTPDELFSNYAYFSSFSNSWLNHVKEYADMMIKRFRLNNKSQIIEIASNDGYLLDFFSRVNISVLGIEPASNVAKTAIKKGIPTLERFFNTKTAHDLKNNNKQADVLIGNNVLAHVPDINDFVKGMKILLKPNGVITMEFPHILQLINQNQFDTIYHEHYSYFSFSVIQKIFFSQKLIIFDVEEIPTHGGSLRIFVKHSENKTLEIKENVQNLIKKENENGLNDISTYSDFASKIEKIKEEFTKFLEKADKENKSVICYGAPAKGNTLLNYFKINPKLIEYTVDLSPHKQGLFLPGTHIAIKKPSQIKETRPDYIIILPWNLKDEIMEQIKEIKDWGGKFVIPIPEVHIVS